MATARYKALKVFVYNEVNYGVGNALILDPSAAEALVEKGQIQLVKYLDPTDPADNTEIDHFTDNPTGAGKSETETENEAQQDQSSDSSNTDSSSDTDTQPAQDNSQQVDEAQQDQDSV